MILVISYPTRRPVWAELLENEMYKRPFWFSLGLVLVALATGCGDSDTADDDGSRTRCRPPLVLEDGECRSPDELDATDGDDADDDGSAGEDSSSPSDTDGGGTIPNPEHGVVYCGDSPPTTLTGRVTIPAGTLPLHGVSVWVPLNEPLPIETGATCEPCGRRLSGYPITQTTTEIDGTFTLLNVPADQPFPLVIEIGKWRRQVVIPAITPCTTADADEELTRLPRNREEGDMPQFGVVTGEFDAMECLLRKIGIDDSEFTTNQGDGSVHLFVGANGTARFDGSLNNGASFPKAKDWWTDVDNLTPYDILVYSCEGNTHGNQKPEVARQALMEYTYLYGGRAFLSHYHYYWLDKGPRDFRDVATWSDFAGALSDPARGIINQDFPKGSQLAEWMYRSGTPDHGEFDIYEPRGSIGWLNTNIATPWISAEDSCMNLPVPGIPPCPEDGRSIPQYFSFNTPVYADEADQCGRVVFSDIHVSNNDTSSSSTAFPNGCTSGGLSDQEKAILFMLFDLARCVTSDKY